jgi:hypothetical protein
MKNGIFYSWLIRMFHLDVALMLFYSDVHGAACLPNVDSAAFTGNLADTGFLSPGFFGRMKETGQHYVW